MIQPIKLTVIVWMVAFTLQTTFAWGQQSYGSQRPLPLPDNGTSNVQQQFRLMQQLQRMVGSNQIPAALPENDSPSTETGLPFDPQKILPNLFDEKQIEEFTKDLNPEQKQVLRELAQHVQTETQKSGKQSPSPVELQDMLQDFLRDRKLPNANPGTSGPTIPDPTPQNPTPQNPTPQNPTAQNPTRPELPRNQSMPIQPKPDEREQRDTGELPTERSPRVPPSTPELQSSTQGPKSTDDLPSTQKLIGELARNPDDLPPVEPPPHLERELAEKAKAESALEPAPEATRPSVDPETAKRLRESVNRRGLAETLRNLYHQTQEEAKQQAINERREKALKAMEDARNAALANQNDANQNDANQNDANQNDANPNAGHSSSLPIENYSGRNSPFGGPPTLDGQSSGRGNIVDQELVDSLLGDQQQLEKMTRELRKRMAEMAAERKRIEETENKAGDSADASNTKGPTKKGTNDANATDSGNNSHGDGDSGAGNSATEPFDLDPLGIGNPTSNGVAAEENDSPFSFKNIFTSMYESLTAGGEVDRDAASPLGGDSSTKQPLSGEFNFALPSLSVLLVLLILVVAAAWWLLRGPTDPSEPSKRRAIYAKLIPPNIRSREDLIQAFHCIALASRAAPPSWWTHPKTAETLASTSPDARSAVYTLAELYELARYSPEGGRLTEDQLCRANEALVQLKGL